MEHWHNKEISQILNGSGNGYHNYKKTNSEDDLNEEDLTIIKAHFAESMTDKEIREVKKLALKQKHIWRQFHYLWMIIFSLKEEYADALMSLCIGEQSYTLYDMICYQYILENEEKYKVVVPEIAQNKNEQRGRSLHKIVGDISSFQSSENSYMSHFDSYKRWALRTIESVFDILWSTPDSLCRFQKKKSKVFNICDWGFISYLLKPSTSMDIAYLREGKIEQISNEFKSKTYIGMVLMARYHELGLDRETITIMWEHIFHVPHDDFT